MSDGEENASKTNLDATISTLLKTEATVYAVNDGDDTDSKTGKEGETTLKQLASATGGAYSRAAFSGDVGSAFGKIRKELRSQYAIAFKPSDHSLHGFHYLEVLAGKLHVHCRSGYYAH
jgi:VWFA-related protein